MIKLIKHFNLNKKFIKNKLNNIYYIITNIEKDIKYDYKYICKLIIMTQNKNYLILLLFLIMQLKNIYENTKQDENITYNFYNKKLFLITILVI